MCHNAPFYAGVFFRVLSLPKSFGEFGGVALSPVFKALVLVVAIYIGNPSVKRRKIDFSF